MADEVIEGMPEFGKPDEIPLVVPDPPERKSYLCTAKKKNGDLCGVPHIKDSTFCLIHDPNITAEQRLEWKRLRRKPRLIELGNGEKAKHKYLSREEVLVILTKRFALWIAKFGDVVDAGVDETLCNLARTYAHVAKIEIGEGIEVRGWRMKGVS